MLTYLIYKGYIRYINLYYLVMKKELKGGKYEKNKKNGLFFIGNVVYCPEYKC